MHGVTAVVRLVGVLVLLAPGLISSPGRQAVAMGLDPGLLLPSCLDTEIDANEGYREDSVQVASGEVTLAGRLFLPLQPGPHPAVVLVHGGGTKHLNDAPLFFAPLLARCGIAALVYDKRGMGASGGQWKDAVFDDFVDDAAAAVAMLGNRVDINAEQIGLIGFSQGGRLAPLVAVRHGQVAFVVSVSAPFTSLIQTRLYALDQRLRRWSLSGSALDSTMALWSKHFKAVAARDTMTLVAMDARLTKSARRYGSSILPPPSHQLPKTPLYNSLGRAYTPEVRALRVPMLAVYGERDAVVPVTKSVSALKRVLQQGGHQDLDVRIIPFADHSFVDWTFNQRIKIEETIIDWIIKRLAALPTRPPKLGTTH